MTPDREQREKMESVQRGSESERDGVRLAPTYLAEEISEAATIIRLPTIRSRLYIAPKSGCNYTRVPSELGNHRAPMMMRGVRMSSLYVILILVIAAVVIAVLLARRRSPQLDPDEPAAPGEPDDARRFARLLVSEIRLYNEDQVNEGRANRDLYARLRSDIDQSREMYEQRVRPGVRAERDYFLDALVEVLADGDEGAFDGYDDKQRRPVIH